MTQEEIDKLVNIELEKLFKSPEYSVKMLQLLLVHAGKEIIKTNAETLKISQHCDLDKKRYKVSATFKIKEI